MTDEQILELAEKLKFCLRDEDDFRMWKVSPSLILEFALAIHESGYDEGYERGFEYRDNFDKGYANRSQGG
jgi:hypothetical protein